MRRRLRLWLGAGLFGGILLITLLAPWLTPYDPLDTESEAQFEPPTAHHPFGTDLFGRDVYTRVLYGGQRTLSMGALAILVTLIPGALIGLVAGYAGRWIDWALMTVLDAVLAIPSLLVALALIALFGNGINQIALAVGIAGIPPYARVTRAAVLEARTRLFVEASRAVGARPAGILWRHVLPTVLPTLLAFAGVSFSWALLNGAALVFLGYGGDISAADWGVMLADGRQAFRTAPWVAIAPGVMLSLTVFAINLLARALGQMRR